MGAGPWRTRERDAGREAGLEPWTPYPTADGLVWAAEACLGYFMTRDAGALGGGEVTGRDRDGLEVELGAMEARIHLHGVPATGQGAFRCNSMRWPELSPSPGRLHEVATWIEARLRPRAGWQGWFEPEDPDGRRNRTIARYRNEALGVTLRVEARHDHPTRRDYLMVSLDADGPVAPD
jgi:hypothetical protein